MLEKKQNIEQFHIYFLSVLKHLLDLIFERCFYNKLSEFIQTQARKLMIC